MATLEFIHRFVPAAGDPPSTVSLLLLHGTGGDENDLLDLGRALSPGAALLSPRGKVSEHGAPRFFKRLAEGVFDLPDLHRQTADLATFIQAAAVEYQLDAERMIAVGFSNGANIAASLLLSRPGVLAGAILLRPMVPFEPDTSPKLKGTPVLIAAGTADPIVSPAQTDRLASLLTSAGATVTISKQPAGHGLIAADVAAASRWLATVMLSDH
jgi:phospholipase/carboxylesterase